MTESFYKLRCSVYGHTSDVRAVIRSCLPGGGFISGSRDKTVRLWQSSEGGQCYHEVHCMRGPSHFISCLCTLPPSMQYPSGLILAGSNDCAIYGFSFDSSQPVMKLLGHSDNVCSLVAGNFGTFVSGSWDKTARVWLGQKCVMVLEGHQEAVWAVEIFKDQGSILTGSADKTIRLWRSGKSERIFRGHELCVRGLAILSTTEFLSCSNDHTIRLWKISGVCIGVFSGHEHYIYSISLLNCEGDFVTSSEDSTIKIWKQGVCFQTIKLPAESLWSVACMQDEDIVVAGSDAVIRVFTKNKELMASESEIVAFQEEMAKPLKTEQKIGDLDLKDLHNNDILLVPGKHDGHTVLCKEGNNACAYKWSGELKEWIKIGNVINANDTKKKRATLNGQEYDYVFMIDVEKGNYLNLPYNVGDDPWITAQNFIHKHGLRQEFLHEIVDFILTNSDQTATKKSQTPTAYSDPFTGANRYIPAGCLQTSTNTGDVNELQMFPLTSYLSFDNANAEGLKKKLIEFSEHVLPCQKLTLEEVQELMLLADYPDTVTDKQMASLDKIMGWPEELVFPALDLFRLAVRSPVIDEKVSEVGSAIIINYLMKYLVPDSNSVNIMLAIRAFCNFFGRATGDFLLKNNVQKICSGAISCIPSNDKKVEIAVVSLFLNYSVALNVSKFPFDSVITDGVVTLTENLSDSEAIYRLLICIGTLMEHLDASVILKCKVISFVKNIIHSSHPEKISLCVNALMKKFD